MNSPAPVRWGIAGPGRIAEGVARDFVHVEGAELVAVGSRSRQRAGAFAESHGIASEHAHGSYADLIADPDVDAVYIATPHPQHHALAIAALRAGKAVLVEKAFTATLAGAQEVVDVARAGGVFAMEAMWTRFQPAIVALRELVAAGVVGDVLSVQADLGVVREFDPRDRLYDRAQGGGAVLDLGVYAASFAQMLLGAPDSVVARGRIGPSGVETDAAILLGYDDGSTATLTVSLHSPMPGHARVFGTDGWIDVLPRFHHPHSMVVHRADAKPSERASQRGTSTTRSERPSETITAPPLGVGYSHELIEVTECLRTGRTESATMPLADTLAVQAVLQKALDQLGCHLSEDATAMDPGTARDDA